MENNVSKACIIAAFETIWNCRKNMKTWKQGRLHVQYDTLWYDILTCREKIERNEAKWCILTFLCSMTFRGSDSATERNEAKWCLLTTFRGSDSATDPIPLQFLLQMLTFYFSHYLRWSVYVRSTGPIGATPVLNTHYITATVKLQYAFHAHVRIKLNYILYKHEGDIHVCKRALFNRKQNNCIHIHNLECVHILI